jgi:hypothetical protein
LGASKGKKINVKKVIRQIEEHEIVGIDDFSNYWVYKRFSTGNIESPLRGIDLIDIALFPFKVIGFLLYALFDIAFHIAINLRDMPSRSPTEKAQTVRIFDPSHVIESLPQARWPTTKCESSIVPVEA